MLQCLRNFRQFPESAYAAVAATFLTPSAIPRLDGAQASTLLWQLHHGRFRIPPTDAAAAVHHALGDIADGARPRDIARLATLAALEPSVMPKDVLPLAEFLMRRAGDAAAEDAAHIMAALLSRGCEHAGALAAFRAVALAALEKRSARELEAIASCVATDDLVRPPPPRVCSYASQWRLLSQCR